MQVGQPSESDENGQEKWYKVHEGERECLRLETGSLISMRFPHLHYIWALHFIPSITDFFFFF